MEPRLPVREWEGSVVLGALLPTVSSGILVVVLVELEGTELVAAAEEAPATSEVVESGAPKSVLVPVGTFVGRTLGGWDLMSSRPVCSFESEGCWEVVPETAVFAVVLSLPSL